MADERQQREQASPQNEFEQTGSARDQDERDQEARLRREAVAEQIARNKQHMAMERALDNTLAESFPASDPPSSIPDPAEVEEDAA